MSFLRPFVMVGLLAALLSGCAHMNARYINGTEYDRAVVLYEHGMLAEARRKAAAIGKGDPNYTASRRLVSDIDSLSAQVSRRHMDLAEDYEKAGILARAVAEYKTSLKFNPSNLLARRKIEKLSEAMAAGVRPEDKANTQARPRRPVKGEDQPDPEFTANSHYLRGKLYLDSRDYGRAIEELSLVLTYMPAYMDAEELLARARMERAAAIDRHMKTGMAYFQAEEMEKAIREWEAVLGYDPDNKTAADYRSRAVAILERLKKIKEKQSGGQPL